MVIGVGIVELRLPGCHSLKEKRGVVKSLTARLHNKFNVSCSELDHNDAWQSASIGVATIANSTERVQEVITQALAWIERNRPDVTVVDHSLEIIH